MSQTDRQKRLRLLIRRLNKQRKQQVRQIDILCNDMINAHRAFLNRLQSIGFMAQFYKSLLGGTDVNDLLLRAGGLLREELPGTGISFFLRQAEGCDLHTVETDDRLPPDRRPEDCFLPELVDAICKSNRLCTLEDLFELGLAGPGRGLNRLSMATLPLKDFGRSLGFVLLYRPLPQLLTAGELQRVSAVLCGLSQAFRVARTPLHASR